MLTNTKNSADRREYFCVDDQVALKYRVVNQAEIEDALERRNEGYLDTNAMASSFASTSMEMKHALEKCKRELPEVATYLEGLNGKVDLLIRLLAANSSELPDHPTHDVNLSASGVSFRVTQEVAGESLLEIKLLFFPSFLFVVTVGRVVRCVRDNEMEAYPYRLAIEFSHLEDSDREILIRHVLQKEASLLRSVRDSD